MTEIVVTGTCPSKKNMLKLTKSGHGYYDRDLRILLNDISDQISRQWGYRTPLVHPAVAVVFYVTSERSDKDNKYTTILDAMVSAGVLEDDSIAKHNGYALILPAIHTSSTAGTKIFVQEDGNFDAMMAHIRAQDFENYDWLKQAKSSNLQAKKRRFAKI